MAFKLMVLVINTFVVLQTGANTWITAALLALYCCAGLIGRRVSGIEGDNKIVVKEV